MRARAWIAVSLALALAACAGPPARNDFATFGGRAGIDALVEDLLVRTASDPRLARHFEDANLVRLHEKLGEQLCVQLDGPCTYTGFPMDVVHDGRDIREADFNILVEHLVDAMDARGIPRPAQNRLLAKLAPMRPDVIER
jgi:hemoglobin